MNDKRDLVTRCPFCTTSFRVTFGQLAMASGTVRCGACLRIFQANDVFARDEAEGFGHLTRQFFELDNDEIAGEEVALEGDLAGKSEPLLLESEYWPDWERYVVDHISPSPRPEAADAMGEFEDPSELEGSAEREDGQQEVPQQGVPQQEVPMNELVSSLHIGSDPTELVGDYVADKKRSPFWVIMVLPLMVTIFLQFAWFNRHIYGQHDEYRPWYLYVCSWVGCRIPDYSNFSLLATTRLAIRPHPEEQDALIVDAIILNSAVYRQRFPLMKLQFRDIEGSLVANRRFNPSEYLAGELRGLRYIPANTEVRISMEIIRPVERAVGFSLEVVESLW